MNSLEVIGLFTCGSKPLDPYINEDLNASICSRM